MPRYEQIRLERDKKHRTKFSYTRQVRSESKQANVFKPLIAAVIVIIVCGILFSLIKSYSATAMLAIKDFFRQDKPEAIALEADANIVPTEQSSFLSDLPIFRFFVKPESDATPILEITATETNSRFERTVRDQSDDLFNTFENTSRITRESLAPFFNNNGSILLEGASRFEDAIPPQTTNLYYPSNSTFTDINNESFNSSASSLQNTVSTNLSAVSIVKTESRSNILNTPSQVKRETTNTKIINDTPFENVLKPRDEPVHATTTMKPVSQAHRYTATSVDNSKNTTNLASASNVLQSQNTNKTELTSTNFLANNVINTQTPRSIETNPTPSIEPKAKEKQKISAPTWLVETAQDMSISVIESVVKPATSGIYTRRDDNNFLMPDQNLAMALIEREKSSASVVRDNNTYTENTASITRPSLEQTKNYGVFLVEYDEILGTITLVFKERDFLNQPTLELAILSLLDGASDYENSNNIISCIPKSTVLQDIFREDKTVYLNFNEDFEYNPLGDEGVLVQIYQIVYTATQFDGVERVVFLIDGAFKQTIGSEGYISNTAFSRLGDINKPILNY